MRRDIVAVGRGAMLEAMSLAVILCKWLLHEPRGTTR